MTADQDVAATPRESGSGRAVIIGAGMCGLMTALALPDYGERLTLIDKGRSVGGRMATRRMAGGRADHGAQFFTVRTTEFADYVEEWRLKDWVFEWATHWSDGSLETGKPMAFARFAAHDGMNALAKNIATELGKTGVQIHLNERVTALAVHAGGWRLTTDHGRSLDAQVLIATAPVPQTLALLETSKLRLDAQVAATLNRVAYAPCLCLLLHVDATPDLPEPGARQTPDGMVTWIADNRRKGISPNACILTVHADPRFSAANYDAPDDAIITLLQPEIAPLLAGVNILEVEVKRWRYALPTQLHPERFLYTEIPAPLYFGGDAFGGPRIEGAALSGLAIAAHLIAYLRNHQDRTVGEA